jgi:hypothetical protein
VDFLSSEKGAALKIKHQLVRLGFFTPQKLYRFASIEIHRAVKAAKQNLWFNAS